MTKASLLKTFAVGLACTLAVTACGIGGGPAPAAGPADLSAPPAYEGTLTVLTKFGMQTFSPYFPALAREYEARHPGVTVELIQETDDSIKDKTKTLVASQSLPDVFFSWTGSWGENFVRGNHAVDLTSVIAPDTPWGTTFGPATLEAFRYNGKYYGVPLYVDGKFMGYDKAVFGRLGLQPPATFEQLLQQCATIKQSGRIPISFGNKESWPALHYAGQLLAYDVPRAVLEKDFVPQTAAYTDPGYVKALDELKALVDQCTPGASSNGTSYSTALEQLANGQAAMYYQEILEFDQSAAEGSQASGDGFGFFKLPVPAGAAGDPGALEGAPEGYMINARSTKIPLALDFMKFVTEKANAVTLSAPPYGQPSAVIGAVTTATASPAVVEGVEQINKTSFLMPWLDTANDPDVAAAWLSGVQALVGGTMTSAEVMAGVQKAAKSVG